mmetsp:Transcript_1085/g.3280  ORF Transcript_1085/g.3280 Transcript_1085/m.3280 type:complete len:207 (-) Transcript_1085:45-665(-)
MRSFAHRVVLANDESPVLRLDLGRCTSVAHQPLTSEINERSRHRVKFLQVCLLVLDDFDLTPGQSSPNDALNLPGRSLQACLAERRGSLDRQKHPPLGLDTRCGVGLLLGLADKEQAHLKLGTKLVVVLELEPPARWPFERRDSFGINVGKRGRNDMDRPETLAEHSQPPLENLDLDLFPSQFVKVVRRKAKHTAVLRVFRPKRLV